MTEQKSLESAVAAHPFPDFQEWWPVGRHFTGFMSTAITGEWQRLGGDTMRLSPVQSYVERYIQVVYGRAAEGTLVDRFCRDPKGALFMSGEFDALSYGFYHHAFDLLAASQPDDELAAARRRFTQRVGRRFFSQLQEHLALDLPAAVANEDDLAHLTAAVDRVGDFLQTEGYLRDHFAFRFDVQATHAWDAISQQPQEVPARLRQGQRAYALYEMGYPIILPSAVYLYQTVGEAQHHSSRTIEELFDRMGYRARETDDFDPSGYPSEMVVELWTIDPVTARADRHLET